jgi:sortase A
MAKRKQPDLSEAELRRMLLERRRQDRARRIGAFRKSGELAGTKGQRAEPVEGEPLSGPKVFADPNLRLEPAAESPRRKWADRLLLAVEALAVVGLAIVLFSGLNLLTQLNEQVRAVFAENAAEASPTPLIGVVVLPSGHTPPDSAGGPQPNEAEIPEHLRPAQQAYRAAISIPTPGPQQPIAIQINAIDVNAPVVPGDDWEALKRGVGQHIGSANPGEQGNLVLTGHNDIYGEVFRYIEDLEIGDEVTVFTADQSYTYVVRWIEIVEPTDVYVMDPTDNASLTMITCYPYRVDTQRVVVRAELVD